MIKTTLAAPWDEYYQMINAMFKDDPDVTVVYLPDEYKIKLYVEKQAKAEVLSLMLEPEMTFGNITVLIEVIPPNTIITSAAEVYREAFRDNPAVEEIVTLGGVFQATYIIFKKEVVQYHNDDIGSPYGLRSTLYETIAKEIFVERPGVYFCTANDPEEVIEYSLGDGTKYYEAYKGITNRR